METVPSTATPIAAETCSEVLTMPLASPASAGGTSAMAIVSSGMNDIPAPRPTSRNEATSVGT